MANPIISPVSEERPTTSAQQTSTPVGEGKPPMGDRPPKQSEQEVQEMVDGLVHNALQALDEYMKLDQEQTDRIAHAMALASSDAHVRLARMAVDETGRGVYEDKIIKNLFASEYIWHSIKDQKSVGIIDQNEQEGTVDVAEPVGVVCGVTPVTNPTSTTIFKALICAKARNPIIFGFHPAAQNCSVETARTLRDAAIAAGAPAHCIQWIEKPSVAATQTLMNHPGVSMILATGGPSMVKSAYSCGKPALGVGPGNVPCYIDRSADVERACTDLMLSKTFDNGMICASEQAVIVDREVSEEFERIMADNGCYFLRGQELELVSELVAGGEKRSLNPKVVGQPAWWIADQAGVAVPKNTKILLAPLNGGADHPLAIEKLSPVLAYFITDSREEGFRLAAQILEAGGMGHSAVIHATDQNVIQRYGQEMRVGRVIANSPSSQGAIGDLYNTYTPSLTLGCGSYGRNSTTANVSTVNLINKKRLAHRRVNMQWFKVPPKIYFENGSIQYLEKMENISRAFIVTDQTMVKLGYVDKLLYHLRKRKNYCHSEIYADVEPDPDVATVMRGVEAMRRFQPDVIIAFGGGSPIDAAKGMWLFYEHPESSFEGMKLKFLDIRKRAFRFPKLGEKTQFVAIPTTSGTGSEVTAFSVITDRESGNIKYPLADYSLRPDVAIIDPQFAMSLPRAATADTGLDVLTHALEAYVSVMASDYTDGLALQAIDMVFEYLPRAYRSGAGDPLAREKMHNASCVAGMAFTNAFLGLNHSMAHKLGGEFHIAHGRANAILLPHIIRYNAGKPTKFATFPKYGVFVADKKYAKVAQMCGFGGDTVEDSINNLIAAVRNLMRQLDMPASIQECGISEEEFLNRVDALADHAHADQCTGANPRYPLVSEIRQLYLDAYYGN